MRLFILACGNEKPRGKDEKMAGADNLPVCKVIHQSKNAMRQSCGINSVKSHKKSPTMPKALLSVFLLTLSPAALSSDMRAAPVMSAITVCLHQDAGYRASLWGKRFESRANFPGWQAFEALPVSRCFRERKWVDPAVCASAVNLDIADESKLTAWIKTNRASIVALEPVTKLVFADQENFTCPQLQLSPDGGQK